MMTGRVLAASPTSANQTSPGWGLTVDQVQHLLLDHPSTAEVRGVVIGEVDDLTQAELYFAGGCRLPFAELQTESKQRGEGWREREEPVEDSDQPE